MKLNRRKVVVQSHEGRVLSVQTAFEYKLDDVAERMAKQVPGSSWTYDQDGDVIVTRPLELGPPISGVKHDEVPSGKGKSKG